MGIISFILGLMKAIPILDKWLTLGLEWWREYQKKSRETQATERKNEKDSAVDAGIDAAINGVSEPIGQAGQQQATDEKAGLPPSV